MFRNLSPQLLNLAGTQSEIIELTLTYGFASMDLDAVEFSERVEVKGMDYARRLIDSAKVKIGGFALPVDLEAEDAEYSEAVAQVPKYAKDLAAVGCTRCWTSVAPVSVSMPYHENFERHRARLSELTTTLAEHGMSLGLSFDGTEKARAASEGSETLEFIHDLDAAAVLVNTVGAKNLGVIVDNWQLYASGGAIDNVKKLAAGQIVGVRLADAPTDVPADALVPTDRLMPGVTDLTKSLDLLTALKEMGYDGPVTPAPSRSRFQGRTRDKMVRSIGEGMRTLWEAAGLIPPRTADADSELVGAASNGE